MAPPLGELSPQVTERGRNVMWITTAVLLRCGAMKGIAPYIPPLRQRLTPLPPLPWGEARPSFRGCWWGYALAPPSGELSPQVTERVSPLPYAASRRSERVLLTL